jgi:hypothetical protein
MKLRFKVLRQQLEYPYEVQVRLIKALCCIHNIIRLRGGDDLWDELWEEKYKNKNPPQSAESNAAVMSQSITSEQVKLGNTTRDEIADKMWSDYLSRQ